MPKINFTPFPVLYSKRFTLRSLSINDDKEIFILRSDKQVIKYLGRQGAKSINDAREFIDKINAGIKNDEWIMWVIESKETATFIGTICLWNLSDDRTKADIGFEILPDHFGKGIMQEVIPIILKYGFNDMQLDVIEGEVDPENIKSIILMEKFGFEFYKNLENTDVYYLKNKNRTIK
jgi:ribosomal-protein-alanine N-acetyltransferase